MENSQRNPLGRSQTGRFRLKRAGQADAIGENVMIIAKIEDFKAKSNNFRTEFIGKDNTGRKRYRPISFKKTLFGSIEDINYYPLMKEFIEIAGKSELLKTVKDYCREHCAWLKTENDIENHAIDCLLSKAYEYWKDFPKQMPEPDKWIFYFKSIKMLERNL